MEIAKSAFSPGLVTSLEIGSNHLGNQNRNQNNGGTLKGMGKTRSGLGLAYLVDLDPFGDGKHAPDRLAQ
jgi:hypothetical protein